MKNYKPNIICNYDLEDTTAFYLGKTLKKMRSEKKISQGTLAALANINMSYYCCIEKGQGNLTVKKLVDICDSLETHPALIMKEMVTLRESDTHYY